MKKLFAFGLFGLLISMTSCASLNKSYGSSAVSLEKIQTNQIKADLAVDQTSKLVGKSNMKYFLFFKVSGDNEFADGVRFPGLSFGRSGKAKSAAAFKALNSTGDKFDILVNPQYTVKVTRKLFSTSISATVEGYGGTYSNFRIE